MVGCLDWTLRWCDGRERHMAYQVDVYEADSTGKDVRAEHSASRERTMWGYVHTYMWPCQRASSPR